MLTFEGSVGAREDRRRGPTESAESIPDARPDARRARRLLEELLPWFDRVRRDLPWRRTKDPYAVWLSEIMLQQTRVETVVPYFERFLRELPTLSALAEAPPDRVMSLWSGLGYYRRARMFHDAARQLHAERQGVIPETAEGLAKVRGIGRYTAGAIASIAFGEQAALVDGNAARVLARVFGVEDDVRGGDGLKKIWTIAEALVPPSRSGDWNQALMELGATTCTPRGPRCLICPIHRSCEAYARGLQGELPRLSPKAKPALSRQVALVAVRKGRCVMARRRAGGLFGGLWEPPLTEDTGSETEVMSAFAALLGIRIPRAVPAGIVLHVLSHKRMQTRVLATSLLNAPRPPPRVGGMYDSVATFGKAELDGLGISTFARKILAAAQGISSF